MNNQRQPLPVVAGPTASGKTGLAVFLATKLGGEVVSADSMQVYRDLQIGTARPTAEEMAGIPHHLMGCVDLSEPYSVARYSAEAHVAIADVAQKGKLPILCGGTGLYIRSVVDNLAYTDEERTPDLRESLRERYDAEGGEALLAELASIDPDTAARLHPNDGGRIIRALELYQTTGITMTQQMALSRQNPSPYNAFILLLDCRDRQVLYNRINRRVDVMLEQGLLTEAQEVLSTPYAPTAMQAIGYKELFPYFKGELTLEEAVENLKRSTRRYAKRQLSWFRRMEGIHPLYIDEYSSAEELRHAALKAVQEYYKEDAQ